MVVRAVPQEERAAGFHAQHMIGLFTADGAPVEATLLELHDGVLNHLILQLRAERFKAVRLQSRTALKQTAAHSVVKLTVGYHGAPSAADDSTWMRREEFRLVLQKHRHTRSTGQLI